MSEAPSSAAHPRVRVLTMGTPTAAEATTRHVLIAPDKFKGSATAA